MRTIEVYRTDVDEPSKAEQILNEIRQMHPNSDPSFDLEDCDNVLRVENMSGVNCAGIEKILTDRGFRIDSLL